MYTFIAQYYFKQTFFIKNRVKYKGTMFFFQNVCFKYVPVVESLGSVRLCYDSHDLSWILSHNRIPRSWFNIVNKMKEENFVLKKINVLSELMSISDDVFFNITIIHALFWPFDQVLLLCRCIFIYLETSWYMNYIKLHWNINIRSISNRRPFNADTNTLKLVNTFLLSCWVQFVGQVV